MWEEEIKKGLEEIARRYNVRMDITGDSHEIECTTLIIPIGMRLDDYKYVKKVKRKVIDYVKEIKRFARENNAAFIAVKTTYGVGGYILRMDRTGRVSIRGNFKFPALEDIKAIILIFRNHMQESGC